jgi:hypothetical protein
VVHWGWGYGFLSLWSAATGVLFLKSLSYEGEEDTYVPYADGEDAWGRGLELVDHGSAHEMQWRHPFSEGGWGIEDQGVSLSALMVRENASVTANVTARPRSGAQGALDMLVPPSPEDVRQWVLNDARYAGIVGLFLHLH